MHNHSRSPLHSFRPVHITCPSTATARRGGQRRKDSTRAADRVYDLAFLEQEELHVVTTDLATFKAKVHDLNEHRLAIIFHFVFAFSSKATATQRPIIIV